MIKGQFIRKTTVLSALRYNFIIHENTNNMPKTNNISTIITGNFNTPLLGNDRTGGKTSKRIFKTLTNLIDTYIYNKYKMYMFLVHMEH